MKDRYLTIEKDIPYILNTDIASNRFRDDSMAEISGIIINNIPYYPGVYIILQKQKILYIGKAKNLRKRISNYINSNDTRKHVLTMMHAATDIEYKVTSSEIEALILENRLINIHSPPFNIKLKYSLSIHYISISKKDNIPIPKIIPTNSIEFSKHDINIGPFPKSALSNKALSFLLDKFAINLCPSKKNKCTNCQISICSGHPSKNSSISRYMDNINKFIKAMNSPDEKLIKQLEKQHDKFCNDLDFENASIVYKAINILQYASKMNFKLLPHSGYIDAIVHSLENKDLRIYTYSFGGNCNILKSLYTTPSKESVIDSIIETISRKNYQNAKKMIPEKILIDPSIYREMSDDQIIYSNSLLPPKCSISPPQNHAEEICFSIARNLSFATNPENEQKDNTFSIIESAINSISPIKKIQCIDIAHFGGKSPIGAIVSFNSHSQSPSSIDAIEISEKNARNDTGAIFELIANKFSSFNECDIPELLIIDGGKAQLNSAIKALSSIFIEKRPMVISICKDKGDHTKKLTAETIYKEDGSKIQLPVKHPALFAIQNIRDHTHNIAKYKMLKMAWKQDKGGIFKNITGVGPRYTERLLNAFNGMHEIVNSSPHIINKTTGIPLKISEKIIQELKDRSIHL